MSNASDFIIENGVLTKYVGPGGDVEIPENVTAIGDSAFRDCSSLTSVVIPEGVTSIGAYAFSWCSSLTSVEIPEGVTSIGFWVFSDCSSLTSVVIPEGVTSIGEGVFWGCSSLTSVVIPDSVTTIGSEAFFGCRKLTSVTLPDNLGSCVGFTFKQHDSLRFRIDDLSLMPAKYRIYAALCFAEDGGSREDPRFESHGKYLKTNAGKLIPIAVKNPALLALLCREKWITAKYMEAFQSAVQETGDAELIAMLLDYENNKLTAKDKEKVEKEKQKQEDTVFERAMARRDREGISGLNFVVTGDVCTFKNSSELKDFIESKGGKLQSAMSSKTDYLITNDAEANSEKKRKAEELGIEIITEYQFNEKAGRIFQIENGNLSKYFGAGGDVVIPEGVTSVGVQAFSECSSLTSVVIPEGVTSIGAYAFSWCSSLTSVVIPEGVTSIGDSAFFDCGALTSVVIPEGVTSIGDSAFRDCRRLTGIVIPESVTAIGDDAYRGCLGMADENGFVIVRGVLHGYYGPGGNVVITEGVTSIGNYAFFDCGALTSVVIPEGVTSIGDSAFSWCSSLTSVVIPEGVTSIGAYAFSWCSSLTSVVIPTSVTSFDKLIFDECKKLTIHAPAGSHAETYAKENNIPFVAE